MTDVVKYWNEQAATFDDEADHGLRDPTIRSAWASLLVPLMPPAPARIADLGCGTGTLAVLLAEAGYEVSGIDFAARMVGRARAKARAAGVDVEFEVADSMTPPWPARSFDALLARHVLWALPNPRLGVERWLELLKPDGRLVLVEGRWETGAGLPAEDVRALVRACGRQAATTPLHDPVLWGGPIIDDRYLLVVSAERPGNIGD
jgi:SAM-dependent methyltransferase